jgi:hypothetical protein
MAGFLRPATVLTTTTTETSDTQRAKSAERTWQASGQTSSGSGAATIVIEVSNVDEADTFMELGTITLVLGTTDTADGFTTCAPWVYARARVSAISGTGASVTISLGYIHA